MRLIHLSLLASTSLVGLLTQAGLPTNALAQAAASLTGQVTSAEEGPMEGVLVNAKKDGSNITVTVVSNDKGQYSFPADRIGTGHYTISIRAVGYDLDGPKAVDVAAGGGKADIKLVKTKNLEAQLSNGEWLISAPGAERVKSYMGNCVGCHTLERVFTSKHKAEEFPAIFKRMGTYSPGSTPENAQPLLPGPRGERPPVPQAQFTAVSEWLASVNLSASDKRSYPLKTLPRPKGQSTKVIITEYDLPRPAAQPHDVIVDPDGMVWYSDFSHQFAGVMDPKTGKATDIPIPVNKPEQPKGGLEIQLDPSGNVWLSMMYQAGIAKIDRKTHAAVTSYPFPKEGQTNSTQASMVAPQHSDVDGKVWTNNQEMHGSIRLDLKTGQYEDLGISKDSTGKQVSGYGMPTDLQNNLYLLEFGGQQIGRVDAKTKEVSIYPTPFANSRPRRGAVDQQNRLWFAEYGGNAIGMFDPNTKVIKEWKLPTEWDEPYDAVATKNGEVWVGSMVTDLVSRLELKTDRITEYLLPRTTNIRRVFVQETGSRPIFWVGSNNGASIVKVEPLD